MNKEKKEEYIDNILRTQDYYVLLQREMIELTLEAYHAAMVVEEMKEANKHIDVEK